MMKREATLGCDTRFLLTNGSRGEWGPEHTVEGAREVGLERRDMIGGDMRDMKEQVCEGERGTRGEQGGAVVLYSGDHGGAGLIGTMGCEERILERWITRHWYM
ncbi:hypothetical protein DEO72_LG9g1310 [Vigna unguiculata]|uniref:Uncharacterized protein n=1 Tax=Vigna unguiculata TaxID=3917 RepID=A0A4D6N1H9_VIGUN|nr:hypothetical protein DEO72_LG9g1310 [Vigna unguiculata]